MLPLLQGLGNAHTLHIIDIHATYMPYVYRTPYIFLIQLIPASSNFIFHGWKSNIAMKHPPCVLFSDNYGSGKWLYLKGNY